MEPQVLNTDIKQAVAAYVAGKVSLAEILEELDLSKQEFLAILKNYKSLVYDNSLDKDKIIRILEANASKIRSFGVYKIGLFGSYVRGEQRRDSDIDFLIFMDKSKKNLNNIISLVEYLEQLFGRKVDLVTYEALPKNRYFTKEVLKQVVYTNL